MLIVSLNDNRVSITIIYRWLLYLHLNPNRWQQVTVCLKEWAIEAFNSFVQKHWFVKEHPITHHIRSQILINLGSKQMTVLSVFMSEWMCDWFVHSFALIQSGKKKVICWVQNHLIAYYSYCFYNVCLWKRSMLLHNI